MLGDVAALIRRPLKALNTIGLDRMPSQGLLALGIAVALPACVAELAGLGPYRPPSPLGSLPSLTTQGADLYARWSYQHRFLLPLYGLLIGLALWVVAAALIHAIGRALGGHGSFVGFLKLAGYVALLGVVALPITLLDALARIQGSGSFAMATGQLSGLVAAAIFLWQNGLLIYAARQHYRISTERAVAAVIGPLAGLVVLGVGVVIVGAILFVLTQQA